MYWKMYTYKYIKGCHLYNKCFYTCKCKHHYTYANHIYSIHIYHTAFTLIKQIVIISDCIFTNNIYHISINVYILHNADLASWKITQFQQESNKSNSTVLKMMLFHNLVSWVITGCNCSLHPKHWCLFDPVIHIPSPLEADDDKPLDSQECGRTPQTSTYETLLPVNPSCKQNTNHQ